MKKKENKKMPRPRQEIIDNPIPTSLFMRYAAVLLFVGTWGCNLRTLVNMYTIGCCLWVLGMQFKNTCKCVHY